MGEKKTTSSFCIFTLLILTVASASQALVQNTEELITDLVPCSLSKGSIQIWEDEFVDLSKIDMGFSDNITVDTNNGTVSIINTYPAWIDSSFSRMRSISITNNGQETFQNYDVNLTIQYDTDMQPDFDDLRFTNGNGDQLSYYKYDKVNSVSCQILVKVPNVPSGTTMIYMFYGNPTAVDQSSFSSIFSWKDRTNPDTMVSFKAVTEGAWDPNVIYGVNRFLVTWEERVGPEDMPLDYERTIPSVIHGRTYDKDGKNPIPDNNTDIDVSLPGDETYHAENPCNAFGAGKYFVVWEENPANQPLYRYEADIKGALLYSNGTVQMRFSICTASYGQFDPQVVYDSYSNRFLVVWADARQGYNDYDIRGRLYTSEGYPVGADFPIAYEYYYQGNPWLCTDSSGKFMIVYEDGPSATLGPFSLYAYRVDYNGNRIGSRITIATGSDTLDYIFPAVSYNKKTSRYLVTWNDGDISIDPNDRESYNGNIWGKILNTTGAVIKNNYIIEPGTSFIRSVSIPYFDTMFFVVYDGTIASNQDLWGRIIDANGMVMTSRQELSDGSSQNVDWNDIAVGADRIFVCWEDERDLLSQYADVFQYVWRSAQSIGSSNISTTFGIEKQLVTQAQLMSVVIEPAMFREWKECFFDYSTPQGTTIDFDIMNQNGNIVLKENAQSGQNISDISDSAIRLRATFTRTSAHLSPMLDKWNISALVGSDLHAPVTEITLSPAEPNGQNEWYITGVTATFIVSDVDSEPENITTYYNINGFGIEVYDPQSPPVISYERPNNYIEYWSNDSVNEEYPHNRLEGIKIDISPPLITLYEPSTIIPAGNTRINGTGTEYASGSGIAHVKIKLNGELFYEEFHSGESRVWFECSFLADIGETYDILVEAVDKAGNKIEERRTVVCLDYGFYETGYIYWFNNPKIGPMKLLVSFGLSIAVTNDTLYVVVPMVSSDATSVKFIATQVSLKREYVFFDENPSDGCSANLLLPLGIYSIKAYFYDSQNNLLEDYTIITKMLVFLI